MFNKALKPWQSKLLLMTLYHIPWCRNPVHGGRPNFSKICGYLKAPSEQLLQWDGDDEGVTSQRARRLGAPLSEAESLYLDLRNVYKDNNQ